MPRKRSKLIAIAQRVAVARRIVAEQSALVAKLQAEGQPTFEADGTLRTYISSLKHLEAHAHKMREETKAKKGETVKKKAPPGHWNTSLALSHDARLLDAKVR
jgi:hypothetical protein